MSEAWPIGLPGLSALAFLPPLYAQAVLLHPHWSDNVSRAGRLVMMPLVCYLATMAPFWHAFTPREDCIGINFRWGIFGPYFTLKALEWGFAKDRSCYTWIGHDAANASVTLSGIATPSTARSGASTPQEKDIPPSVKVGVMTPMTAGNGSNWNGEMRRRKPLEPKLNGKAKKGSRKVVLQQGGGDGSASDTSEAGDSITNGDVKFIEHDVVEEQPEVALATALERSVEERRDGPVTIARWALALLFSMRGFGWSFGPARVPVKKEDLPSDAVFLARTAVLFLRAYLSANVIIFLLALSMEDRAGLIGKSFPFLPPSWPLPLAKYTAWFFVGLALPDQMSLGFHGLVLLFYFLHTIPRLLPLPSALTPEPFDQRDWPPLFDKPFQSPNITEFWSRRYHSLFRKPFSAVGYDPAVLYLTPLLGKKGARMVGVASVFGLSAYMHDMSLHTSLHELPPRSLSFLDAHGAKIYFALQASAVIFENVFHKATGRRIRGPWGTAWSYTILGLAGLCLAGRSWYAKGIAEGIPEPKHWGVLRFASPNGGMLPKPIWLR